MYAGAEASSNCCYPPCDGGPEVGGQYIIFITIFSVCGQAQDGCCTPATPCDLGGGDCDSDLDCAGSLVCGTDNCRQHHSGAVAAQSVSADKVEC